VAGPERTGPTSPKDRPANVADRYRKPGFPIIEAADAPGFVRLAAIGMVTTWIVGLVSTFKNGGGLERLSAWWILAAVKDEYQAIDRTPG
jgi:hypothetical protein